MQLAPGNLNSDQNELESQSGFGIYIQSDRNLSHLDL